MKDLTLAGHQRLILRNDQEPAVVALQREVKKRFGLGTGGEVLPGFSTNGESKSNGEIERAVQEVHGILCALKELVEYHAEVVLGHTGR